MSIPPYTDISLPSFVISISLCYRCARQFGTTNKDHPYIKMIYDSGDWLCGGELEVLERITWGDGLDHYRLTPNELRVKFRELNVSLILAAYVVGFVLFTCIYYSCVAKVGGVVTFYHLAIHVRHIWSPFWCSQTDRDNENVCVLTGRCSICFPAEKPNPQRTRSSDARYKEETSRER